MTLIKSSKYISETNLTPSRGGSLNRYIKVKVSYIAIAKDCHTAKDEHFKRYSKMFT